MVLWYVVLLMFVLFLSPASAEDKISLFSFSLDVIPLVIALRVHSTWITTTAFYLPESCQWLGHSSSYAMFRKLDWRSFWSPVATTRVVVTLPRVQRFRSWLSPGFCCLAPQFIDWKGWYLCRSVWRWCTGRELVYLHGHELLIAYQSKGTHNKLPGLLSQLRQKEENDRATQEMQKWNTT